MTQPALLPIGELASATGVAVSALRHYDEVGVITPADRIGGKRWFASDTVGRVNFVRLAQRFGFSLDEIRRMLDETSESALTLASRKLDDLRAQRLELANMIELLESLMTCGCEAIAACPRIWTHA